MADVAADLKNWSATESSNSPSGTTAIGTGLDDNLRQMQATVRQDLANAPTDVASASTCDIGAVASNYIRVTGTTTITAFGTVSSGIWKFVRFAAALTLTYNATSLITLTGKNRTTAAGDCALYVSEGSGNWRELFYSKAGATQTLWAPAVAMVARTTSGAAAGSAEMATNRVMFRTLDFDASTDEFAQFAVRMPKGWDEGTITAAFTWSHAAAATFAVVWGIQAVALSDDDAGDTAFGTAQTVTDTGGTTNDVYISAATSAVTIAGSPAAEDWVVFQVYRDADNASDTLNVDARLHGVTIYYSVAEANDA